MDPRIVQFYENQLTSAERKALIEEAYANRDLKDQMITYQHLQTLVKLQANQKDDQLGHVRLKQFKRVQRNGRVKNIISRLVTYAAIALLCIGATLWTTNWKSKQGVSVVSIQQLTVPAGQRAHLILPDGTRVWINAGSTLRYPSTFGTERNIELNGEAFFDVKKANTPFIVHTAGYHIKALGTKFNVFSYNRESFTTSLIEGSIKVYQAKQEHKGIILSPNQQLNQIGESFIITSISDDLLLWRDGIYAFHQQQLGDILKKLELYFDVHIEVKDKAILKYEYSGKFRQRDGIMEILRIMQKVHPFKINQNELSNEITLYN